jgi:pentatricopeptide repeat protein
MKITLKPLADMREAGAPRDPYTTSNAMFAACAAGGQWERALELLDELEEPMLRACAREGLWHEALSLLEWLEYGSGAHLSRVLHSGRWSSAALEPFDLEFLCGPRRT